jgi:hypothetical protein
MKLIDYLKQTSIAYNAGPPVTVVTLHLADFDKMLAVITAVGPALAHARHLQKLCDRYSPTIESLAKAYGALDEDEE